MDVWYGAVVHFQVVRANDLAERRATSSMSQHPVTVAIETGPNRASE